MLAARANNSTKETIFFRPMPGVADSSAKGMLNKSRSVRPRKASGRRRSLGSAQIGQRLIQVIGVGLGKEQSPQALKATGDLQFFDRRSVAESHHVLLPLGSPVSHRNHPDSDRCGIGLYRGDSAARLLELRLGRHQARRHPGGANFIGPIFESGQAAVKGCQKI